MSSAERYMRSEISGYEVVSHAARADVDWEKTYRESRNKAVKILGQHCDHGHLHM